MKKSLINTAVAAVLVSSAPAAFAAITVFNWTGNFAMLDPSGGAVPNTSITAKGANQYQTPVTGTMAFDTVTGAATATLVPFEFFKGTSPVEATSFNLQAIGNGMGGPGTLIMGNMLFNWTGNNGIPVSIVMDAAGFFTATGAMWGDGTLDQADVAGTGAVPASDGTYTNAVFGYLNTGPVPIATTEWDVTRAIACVTGVCMDVDRSGVLPLVTDTALNGNELAQGDGVGVGGVPIWDGPFPGFNANFDILSMTMTSCDCGYSFGSFDVGPEVPVPAAVWLFGSGLLGLIGFSKTSTRKLKKVLWLMP